MRAFIPLLLLSGCALYGDRPAHLVKVSELHHKAVVDPPPAKKAYVETCTVYLHEPGKVVPQRSAAAQRVVEGDAKLVAAGQVRNDDERVKLVLDGIGRYTSALKADPFDADATLHLALAYDATLRKGCALKLLDRLSMLAKNPKISPHAAAAVNDVQAHTAWFGDYRTDATDAVQGLRPTP
jgi:hypothetical protein